MLLCRKGAVLVLAEPEARRPIGRETCNAVSAVQRGQRGDYGHVVGVPALVAFCGVGRLPLTGRKGQSWSWRSLRQDVRSARDLQRGQRGERGQRGDYGHVVGVPALVAFCGVGRLPPHRRRQ